MNSVEPGPEPVPRAAPAAGSGPSCSTFKDIRVHFTEAEVEEHRRFRKKSRHYVLESRFFVLVSAPVIWMCAIPVLFTDIVATIYQSICFPIYGIPKVHRRGYVTFDRSHLGYLNFLEKANCEYCAYVNGILAYFTEIAARTEQHWCPIKHSGCSHCAHSRYGKFLEFGNARAYRENLERIRRDYGDLDPDYSADRRR